jgi:hypothetical protein
MHKSGSLPTIKDMYNCTRENYDYNVIRHYEGKHKSFAINTKATKKDHYLDQSIKLNCSPGPASISFFMQTTPIYRPSGSRSQLSSRDAPPRKHTST